MTRGSFVTRECSRRDFVAAAWQIASLAGCALIAGACGGSPSGSSGSNLPIVSSAVSAGVASLAIDPASPLAAVGGIALVAAGNSGFLVARTGDTSFSAVSAVCTHEGCTVSGFSGSTYICPCHGSEFSATGAVLRGPANRPLPSHAAAFADGVLTITL